MGGITRDAKVVRCVTVGVAILSLILVIASSFSGWGYEQGIKDVSWADFVTKDHQSEFGTDIQVHMALGLQYFVAFQTDPGKEYGKFRFEDGERCRNVSLALADSRVNLPFTKEQLINATQSFANLCESCAEAVSGLAGLKYTALFSHMGGLVSAVSRVKHSTNSKGNRYFSMLMALISVLSTVGTVYSFKSNCYDHGPTSYITPSLGPAFVLFCVALVCDLALVVLHGIAPHNEEAKLLDGTPFHCCCFGTHARCCFGDKAKLSHGAKSVFNKTSPQYLA